jgi:predicted nucleic acid-binding protein
VDRTYVINASPLILFGKISRLDLVALLGMNLVVPGAVLGEIAAGSDGPEVVRAVEELGKFRIVSEVDVPRSIARWELGAGESQVLAVALENPSAEVVIDDLAARKCARTLGCPMIGSVGLVALSKQRGLIPLAKPILAELINSGLRISESVIARVLNEVGESSL